MKALSSVFKLALLCSCSAPTEYWPPDGPVFDWAAATWKALPTPTKASLRALCVVDAKVVWATGDGGTVLRTLNGGWSWQSVAPPDCAACDFRDVEAFDALTAVAMVGGPPARVFRTTDGGRTWKIVHEDKRPEATFAAIAFAQVPFANPDWHGFLLGDPVDGAFTFLSSDDGGVTWRPVERAALPAPAGPEAVFAASGACMCAHASPPVGGPGYSVQVSIVTGGAASRYLGPVFGPWSSGVAMWSDLPLVQGGVSRGAFGVAFLVYGPAGVAVGGDCRAALAEGTAAWTADGGLTWHACEGGAGGFRSCALWLDGENVLAVGEPGASLSSDQGRTWRPLLDRGFHACARGADGNVFACGSDGRVARLVAKRLRRS